MAEQASSERPLPGDDGPVCPGSVPGDDFDDGHFEWVVRELEAGRLQPPPESAVEGPAVSVSLGDACDVDPALLAAVCGPGGLGGQAFEQAAQLVDFLRSFNITFEPIAREDCDHRHAEDRYVPSRKLKHLLRARNQTCTAPACNAQALYCDIDHTVPYPEGPTDECNTSPKCRRHHRAKQAPGWKTTQPTPGTTLWTTPAGRTHASTPTAYDL